MISKLKRLLALPPEQPEPPPHALQLAAAVLLMEVARSDFEIQAEEEERLTGVLERQFELSEDELAEITGRAGKISDRSVSLYEHVDLVNKHFSIDQKQDLLKGLWDVAYADGELHRYEEAIVRRVAELLHLPHRDFIRTKHQAAPES